MPNNTDKRWETAKQELADAAAKAGVSPEIVAKIAGFESQYDPHARPIASYKHAELNTATQFDGVMAMSSAYGYGQFTDATWAGMVRQYGEKYGVPNASQLTDGEANSAGLRDDSVLQAGMLAEFTKRNVDKGAALGGSNLDANVYALHNLGESTGTVFLKALKANPNERVDAVLSRTIIERNPGLYGDGSLMVKEAYDLMGQQLSRYAEYAEDIQSVTPNLITDVQAVFPARHTLAQAELADPSQHQNRPDIALKEGAHGEAVRSLQTQLAALGYHDIHGYPLVADGFFGPQTRAAVEAFQGDHHLQPDGVVGPLTQRQLNTQSQLQAVHSDIATFADPDHPQHAVYAKLKEVLPVGTSEARLAQFTTACHLAGMDRPDDISAIHIGESDVVFMPRSLMGVPASIDLLEPAPAVQASMQQAQAYDQQCVQSLAQFQVQQQQIDAQVQQGPVLGGSPTQ